MHQNRLIYKLPEYQAKLRNNYRKLGLFLQNNENNKIFIFRPLPNCPWLPESRKKYFKKLRSKLESLPASRKYTFATLTYSTRSFAPVAACERIKHDIDLFFKRLGYHHRKVQYFYIIEMTDQLMPHIHIIFDQFIPWKKLRSSWVAVTGNTVTNIKHLPQKSAFSYCLKYLSDAKKQSATKWEMIFKHIDRIWTCSRGFLTNSDTSMSKFQFMFSLFDPHFTTDRYFADPDNDLISNEVEDNDAIVIAGFGEFGGLPKILHASDSWTFRNVQETKKLPMKKNISFFEASQLPINYK